MYKKSKSSKVNKLFIPSIELSNKQVKELDKSKEAFIYEVIYKNIDESDYAVLYDNELNYEKELKSSNYETPSNGNKSLFSEEVKNSELIMRKRTRPTGRPNTPISGLITALVILNNNGWTHEDLFNNLKYNLLTRRAFGVYGLDESIFSEATFYKFQQRLLEHWINTGVNLLELTFQKLTNAMVSALGLKTNIVRIDSFQAMSNISSYSRVRLTVEVLSRVFRILSKEDKELYKELFAPYLKKSSNKYVYDLNSEERITSLDTLGEVYGDIYNKLNQKYCDNGVFKIFIRVLNEQFSIDSDDENNDTENKFIPKDKKDLSSGMLQSPDDEDATFRTKRGESFKGQAVTVTEIANPENDINLIIDVSTDANNIDDSNILASRIDGMNKQYTDINEIHTDGAYGSESNDKKLDKLGITLIPTAIRGRKSKVEIIVSETEVGDFTVECPAQKVIANEGKKKYKALFNNNECEKCPLVNQCKIKRTKKGKILYFSKEQLKANIRNNKIMDIPKERRKLRPNVEATIKEFSKNLNHKGKFKVRTKFKIALHAIASSIAINLGRIFRLFRKKVVDFTILLRIYVFFTINPIFPLKNKPTM
ncbi:MAG: transposase [Candidatus Woesearchaeota archaeon]|jgi:hypothetical protein|nr:transposase [Candidatus Woesearchaeota archaeon]